MPFKIPVRMEGSVALVNPADILYADAEEGRAYLHTEAEKLPTQFTLSELEERLRDNYPQIKEMKTLWNVTGAVDGFHIVLGFESLADEEDWAAKIMQDQHYRDWFEASIGVLAPMVDHLYREVPRE